MSEDTDFVTAAERHHQIMEEGNRFFRRLLIGIIFGVVLACGIGIYLLTQHPFWKYP